jgi:N,N-dimethylformamidase
MRPTHRYHVGPWQFAADLALLAWLDDSAVSYDVATDEDLHSEGYELLAPYLAVVTGTHPEYYSTAMLDAIGSYLDGGGRLAYLGANGFYWRVAFDPARPGVMEVRRGQGGSRAWEAAPGEGHLALSGERCGLWRHLGRSPQKLTGSGYSAQGFDRSGWYRRLPDSFDPRVAFVFDGVDPDRFGTSGTIGGGAVGQELDRYDRDLGSPPDALLLATSEGLTEGYQRCVEEILFTVPGTNALCDPLVRADVVYHVKAGGGAVFAAGSIAWTGALGVDRDVSRITRNVLERFVDPAPLPW